MIKINNKKGFTLIELLVVIAILGILTTLLISNVAGARERARDSKRKADLKEIRNALEMYKQDNSAYPGSLDLLSGGTTVYMKTIPTDPLSTDPYVYSYTRNVTDPLMYTLVTCLENLSDPDGTSGSCSEGLTYTVTEP
ncbi:prepilin-type N-terminal cleavage/methylation domain-containing protein [Patescibacteria group bacterium]|nr:prepilin-type N-terminal cleavage/methylation domain-containing protein [Patescibacteria group bacterium]